VRTDDGFELDSDTLKYWADEERVFTRDAVRFRRGTTSGTARAMEYATGAGLALHGDVRVRVEDGAGPPADIAAESAWASRDERVVRFEGGVVARQGEREMRSQRLQLNLTEDLSRSSGRRRSRTWTSSPPPGWFPGSAAPGGGTKRLRCRRLNVVFAEGNPPGSPRGQQRVPRDRARPGEARERRADRGAQLRFGFDEEGRLVSLQGCGPG